MKPETVVQITASSTPRRSDREIPFSLLNINHIPYSRTDEGHIPHYQVANLERW